MLVLSIVFSVIILCSATGVYIYISKTFIEPLQQIYKLLETLNKSEFTYLRPLTLKYAHDYFKKIFYGLTESVKIVHRLEMKRNQSEKNLRYNEIKYREFADFLVNKLGQTDLGARFPHKVTYHDGCHGLRELGIKAAPRALLG